MHETRFTEVKIVTARSNEGRPRHLFVHRGQNRYSLVETTTAYGGPCVHRGQNRYSEIERGSVRDAGMTIRGAGMTILDAGMAILDAEWTILDAEGTVGGGSR